MTRKRPEGILPARRLGFVACMALSLSLVSVVSAPAAGSTAHTGGIAPNFEQGATRQATGEPATDDGEPTIDPAGIVQSGSRGEGSDGAGDSAPSGGGGGAAQPETSGGSDLPFSGYPVTALIAVAEALLAAGLAIRLFVSVRKGRTGVT